MAQSFTYKLAKTVTILFFISGYLMLYILTPHTSFTGAKSFEVKEGEGSRAIASRLKREGFTDSKWLFVLWVTLRGTASALKPGTFVFDERASIPAIAATLARGGIQEVAITIPEGWNMLDIAEHLEKELMIPKERTFAAGFFPETKFDFLKGKPEDLNFEGYLFPDTYRVFQNATPQIIFLKMLENFDRKLTPELREEITHRKKSVHEVITMASLIEKEVVSDEDRAIVSGVLWKRLAVGMPLQVDATITFIKRQIRENPLQNVAPKIRMPVTSEAQISTNDTKIDSPYNTYRYAGLPPGPIANPGLSAIRAALSPKSSEYFYYLSAPDGKTVFSKTLEAHNIAKAKYLRSK